VHREIECAVEGTAAHSGRARALRPRERRAHPGPDAWHRRSRSGPGAARVAVAVRSRAHNSPPASARRARMWHTRAPCVRTPDGAAHDVSARISWECSRLGAKL
jgi:hypothetical protein